MDTQDHGGDAVDNTTFLKREILQLKSENERLKKQMSQPHERVQDSYTLVQQVSALVSAHNTMRDEKTKLQEKIQQLNADIARILKGK